MFERLLSGYLKGLLIGLAILVLLAVLHGA